MGVGGGEEPFLPAPTLTCPWAEQTMSGGAGAHTCPVGAHTCPVRALKCLSFLL